MRPELSAYRHLSAGKVRELYEIDASTMLMVASDRISAFDHILSTEIPDKGRILTAMSMFFFDRLGMAHHVVGPVDDERIPQNLLGRALVVQRLEMLPAECVSRGYLTGSGLAEYQKSGTVCGISLPAGLREASELAEPIFTPATKAEIGDHDENISFTQLADLVGSDTANELKEATLSVYRAAAALVKERGILLADTKIEFGRDGTGKLVLADEVLTPDSSRYWPADHYQEGRRQPSFDKQFVRDWLTSEESGWDVDSEEQPPALPDAIVSATRSRYIDAYERISGLSFESWPGALA